MSRGLIFLPAAPERAQHLKLFEKFGRDAAIVNIRGSVINSAALIDSYHRLHVGSAGDISTWA
ncbi:MAG: hypothetical protein EXR70_04160 [Deltaproteobacteria bacterium]|nr:hypothetical protein [Deltaproteobacteria bacterium]